MNIHKNIKMSNGNNNASKSRLSILKYLQQQRVITTSEISEKMKLSWNTAEKRLLELAVDAKVMKIKKAGVNLWVIK